MPAQKITQLTDILTKEVSLVDRAANKRKFLLTKADGDTMDVALVPDGNGGFVTPTAKAAEQLAARPHLVEAVEKLTLLANAPTPEGGEGEIAKAVSDVVAGLVVQPPVPERVIPEHLDKLAKADAAEIQKMVYGALAKLAEVAQSLGVMSESEDPSETRWRVIDALSGMMSLAEVELAAKRVAAMPPPPAVMAKSDADVAKDKAEAAAVEKYRSFATALKKSLDSSHGIVDDTGVSKPTDFDPATASKLLDDATQVIKSLTGRIAQLEGSVTLPNALPVEGDVTKSDQSTVWPLDMNAPDEVHF